MRIRILFIFFSLSVYSAWSNDSITVSSHKKVGWNIGPLPALGFDSDRGLLLGVLGEAYYFGDGSIYPEFFHKVKMETSFYTKGSANLQLLYDSRYLIKGIRTMFEVGYFPDRYYDFFGLNGFSNPIVVSEQNRIFHRIQRDLFRMQADFQGRIVKQLFWAAGLNFQSFRIQEMPNPNLEQSLFGIYRERGLLADDQAYGGKHVFLKLGLVYDTRDFEPEPSKGFCSEVLLQGSPDIIDRKGYQHIRISINHKHFVEIMPNRLILAARAGYQNTLLGKVPYYLLQNLNTFFQKRAINEGLGGATSLRGVYRNRIVSEGIGFANIEARVRLASFRFINQNWHIGVNPFFDTGMILDAYRANEFEAQPEYESPYRQLHSSVGMGVKLVMNRNFILSADFGKALDKNNGSTGLYVLLNYMF